MRCAGKILITVIVGAMVAGCGQQVSATVGRDPGSAPVSTTDLRPSDSPQTPGSGDAPGSATVPADAEAAAGAVLAAWDAVLAARPDDTLVVAGDMLFPAGLTRTIGDWSQADDSGAVMSAVAAGAFEYYLSPAIAVPPTVDIRRPDGSTITVPVVDAATAVAAARADGTGQHCAGCPVTLTSPVLGITQLTTPDGPVPVPAWDFTVAGTSLHLTRVAVDPDHLVTWDDLPDLTGFAPWGNLSAVTAARVTGPRSLSVDVHGANPTCAPQLEVTPVETALTFTVVVTQVWVTGTTCDARAYPATVEVQLASPIGDRTMIDLGLGGPVVLQR